MEPVFDSMSGQKRRISGSAKDGAKKSRSMDEFVRKSETAMDDVKLCLKLLEGWMSGGPRSTLGPLWDALSVWIEA